MMLLRAAILSFLLFAFVATGNGAERVDETIQSLLDYVAASHGTFIRNGTEHTSVEAVEHLQAKYNHFKSQIRSPEDFIRLCASKSLLSGKPYLVRLQDGSEKRVDEWLTAALAALRAKPR